MFPKWDRSYSVQNNKIDAQHRRLFEIAEQIEYMFDKPIIKENLKKHLIELFNYMRDHFKDEEEYMKTIAYPELKIHRRIHKEIIRSMVQLIRSIKTTNDLKERLYFIIKKWLLEHILYEDMKVEEFRRSLISLEKSNGETVALQQEESDEIAMYFYTCECSGRIHDVSFEIHQGIENKTNKIRCKECKKPLIFYKKEVFTLV